MNYKIYDNEDMEANEIHDEDYTTSQENFQDFLDEQNEVREHEYHLRYAPESAF